MPAIPRTVAAICLIGFCFAAAQARAADSEARPPRGDADLRYWLQNMVWYHHYTNPEIAEVTGLTDEQIDAALKKFDIRADNRPARAKDAPLLTLPYPGGRHPRIGFLDGAVNPQRETKISVFTPWEPDSYVVVDVPEAVFSNLGLTYLAHTHTPFPTIWTKQNVTLDRLEWNRRPEGTFDIERKLPNRISYLAKVYPGRDAVQMELWLVNGTDQTLSDLRVQNCVMLKGAKGFEEQTNANKTFKNPYVYVRNAEGNRWIITAWQHCNRPWGNAPCPCLHSDPKFPDCPAGKTERLRGWLSFYEGTDIDREIARIDALKWADEPALEDVAFTATVDQSEQRYAMIMPSRFDNAQAHDMLIVLHGHTSDRWQFVRWDRDECRAIRDFAARHNMLLVSPEYRPSTSWMGPKAEADVVQIIADLKQKYRIARVFISGGSMGGTSALAFAAMHPDLVAGVASLNGTCNLVEYTNFSRFIAESYGGTKTQVLDEYKKRSAEYWPERLTMPIAMTTGGKDTAVPPQSCQRLEKVLKLLGRDVLLIHREDVGHATNYDDSLAICEFMLEKAAPAGSAKPAGGK